ncbi:MAG TPA: 5'-methylthioadenosine/S-adenosylhomocysteine nucleosidase, partial [Nitrolancea sp.]|nr:5'-methylthioadenosine/S-adenosylhomocysteine nucleosidase [Nitrolancea sp.]
LAIVCAMKTELRHAMEATEITGERRIGPWTITEGSIERRAVRLVRSGIGMVNAGAALSALLAVERPAAVLNYGCAGAHRADLLPGDVVIGERVVAPQSLTILPGGEERYTGLFCALGAEDKPVEEIDADPGLLAGARHAAEGWQPERWPGSPRGSRPPVVERGVVASADCWTQHAPRIEALHGRHGSLCEDMEAAALAQVCHLWSVPFLTVKDISNNELLAVTELGDDLPTLEPHLDEIGRRAWALLRRTLPLIP